MKNSSEKPKEYSPEEMAELTKSRVLSDAEMIRGGRLSVDRSRISEDDFRTIKENEGGAKYKFNEKGQGGLEFTKKQIEDIKKIHDKDTVIEFIRKNGTYNLDIVKYLSPELRANKEVILEAILTNGESLKYASPELLADKEVVLAAVKKSSKFLEYVSKELRADREVVLEAAKSTGGGGNGIASENAALFFASEELQNDEEIFLEAIKHPLDRNDNYSEYKLMKDKEFVMKAIKVNPSIILYVGYKFGKELILEALKYNWQIYGQLSRSIHNDKEFVLEAIKYGVSALKYAPEELKADKEVVLAALKKRPDTYEYVSSSLKNDPDVIKAAGLK